MSNRYLQNPNRHFERNCQWFLFKYRFPGDLALTLELPPVTSAAKATGKEDIFDAAVIVLTQLLESVLEEPQTSTSNQIFNVFCFLD